MIENIIGYNGTENAVIALTKLYTGYGYKKFKFSKFEEYDLYAGNKSFLKCENIITFSDLSGRLLALKPDITLSIVRSAQTAASGTLKYFYNENVYRVPRGSREYREIMQVGLELIGNVDMYSMCEAVSLALESLKLLGNRYTLDVSHLGFISGLLDELGVETSERNTILEYISEKNRHGLLSYCSSIGADSGVSEKLSLLCTLYGEFSQVINQIESLSINKTTDDALCELKALYSALSGCGYAYNIMLDFSVVSDVDYYNGIIFQGYVEGVSSLVLSGGRYDPLLSKFGKDAGAIGFAVYTDALEASVKRGSACDVDALLLYRDTMNPETVLSAVRSFNERGLTVRAEREVPLNLRYAKLYELTEEGVCEK